MARKRQPTGVFHLTSEYWPFARTGGLGQAVAGLAAFQAGTGLPTTVVVPLYRAVHQLQPTLESYGEPLTVKVGPATEEVRVRRLKSGKGKARVLFIDHPASFDREGIYGEAGADYADNARRFALFCLAALELVARESEAGLVVHAHDWHAALTPVYLRLTHAGRRQLDRCPCVLTTHNAGFQGHFGRDTMAAIGLPGELWALDRMEWYGRLNYLKGGLLYADMVTTVSPTHARELCTEVGGFGLHASFQALGERLVGIRNGIEQTEWDPAADSEITLRYSADDLAGKARCKAALQRTWNLPQRARTPLFGMSARLVAQKGLDLILGDASLTDADAQFVFLGEGEERYQSALGALASSHPERIGANFRFTDRLEHRLLAGSDFLLMPSLYEPCGLTQMRAQNYGSLPVARRVGGLADTIEDGVTGFLFDGYAPGDFDAAVHRATDAYARPEEMQEHIGTAMRRDFSWEAPCRQYLDVYRRALERR
jgi:starch synthase